MASSPNIVLYGSGLFGRNTPGKNAAELAALQQSGFTTVILWTLHVDPDGTLVYNDTVIVRDGVFADTGIAGGFVWNSSAIFAGSYTPGDYAQAIIAGLAAGVK